MTGHKPTAVIAAEQRGHKVESDPPAAMTAAQRWTCVACGDAVLDYLGNVYGAAVERDCVLRACGCGACVTRRFGSCEGAVS